MVLRFYCVAYATSLLEDSNSGYVRFDPTTHSGPDELTYPSLPSSLNLQIKSYFAFKKSLGFLVVIYAPPEYISSTVLV